MISEGWSDDEIKGALDYENTKLGYEPTIDEERDIKNYIKYRDPNAPYESRFQQKEQDTNDGNFINDVAEYLADFISNTNKNDGAIKDSARFLTNFVTSPASKLALSISPNNSAAQALSNASDEYANKNPSDLGGVSLGIASAFNNFGLVLDGAEALAKEKLGLNKPQVDQQALDRYIALEKERELRKSQRRTEQQNLEDKKREEELNKLQIDGVGSFLKYGALATKDFMLDLTEAFGSEMVSEMLLDPLNLIPVGGGYLSAPSKKLLDRVVIGAAVGAATNAPIAGGAEYLKTIGMGNEDKSAFLKGASAGAIFGAGFGGVGGALAPTSKETPIAKAQNLEQKSGDPQVKTTPISSVKNIINEIQSNHEETARNLGVASEAAKSINIENNKEQIISQAQKDLYDEMKVVGKVVSESDAINEAMIKAANDEKQPNINISDQAKELTKVINGGNSVTDPRLSGTGIVNIISNEIQAKQSGASSKTPEELFAQLKQRGVSDDLAQAATSSFNDGNTDNLISYVSEKINESVEQKVVQKAIQNTVDLENKTSPQEKVLKDFIFSDDLSDMYDVPMRYKVVSASSLQPNFKSLTGTQYRARDNTSEINKVSQSFRPELHFGQGGFEGIPIIDYKNRIISGNHRAEGIKNFTPESRDTYNRAAKEYFGENVFDEVPYDDPVIVRELLSKDDDLIARMSAYSNDRRVSGDGEKLAVAGGKYADRLKDMDERGVIIKDGNDLIALGNLNSKDLVESERALLYYQSPDIARALEQYAKAYPEDLRFAEIFTRNAINFWNLRQITKKFNNTEADVMPYLARAIEKMSVGKSGNKKAMKQVLDEWEDILAPEMGLSGKGEKLTQLYDLEKDFFGDVFGILLNYLSGLKDSGYESLSIRLKALQQAIEERNTDNLFIDTILPITQSEAISYMMKNERDTNTLMNAVDFQRFQNIAEHILLKEDKDVSINTDDAGVVRLNEELQGDASQDTITGGTDGYSAGLVSERGSDRQDIPSIEREGQELPRSEILPDDTGFDTSHTVQSGNETISDRQGDVSETGLPDSFARWELQGQSGDPVIGTQLSTNRQERGTIDLLSDSTTQDLAGNEAGIGATTSVETRADTSTAPRTIDADAGARNETIESRRQQQSRAERYTTTNIGDADNIAQQLPYLLPEQILDVKFVEDRFATNRGVLITNQTGTGKTLSGLGVAKRFLKQGKENILIVTPNQQKVSDWIDEGKNLLINIARVENTKDAPDGVIATTYANFYQNKAILEKTYDLVIYDESHSLLENKRGEETSRLAAHKKITWENYAKKLGLDPFSSNQAIIDSISKEANNGKVMFLSATPFSSPRSLEYANGMLFDKTNIESLLMDKFGYIPNERDEIVPPPIFSGIDVGALERAFADSLVSSGAMRGRKLNNGKDYARQFMKITNSFASKFEEGMRILSKTERYSKLYAFYKKKNGWIYLSKMGESVKAKEMIPFIKEAISDNNKIVIFHKFIDGGVSQHPFKLEKIPNNIEFEYNEFRSKYPQFFEDYVFENPIDLYKREFGKSIAFFNGTDKGIDGNSTRLFNDDNSDVKIIMVQSDAGSAGISLHDTTGKFKRIIVKLNLPTRPVAEIQSEGRTYRVGQKTNTAFVYPITGGFTEAQNFSTKINESIGSVENLAMGDGARNLRESFRQDYINGRKVDLSYKNLKFEGGVEKDNSVETRNPFYMAKMMMDTQKDGEVPYPIALKMSEWADVRGFDSVLNPNAGSGVFAKYLNSAAGRLTALEKDVKNFDDLMVYAPNAKNEDFSNYAPTSSFDQVVIDVPNKDGLQQLWQSINLVRRGGRIVSYVSDDIADKVSSFGDAGYSIVSNIKMPKSLGGKNVLIIDKVEQLDPPMKIDLSDMGKDEALRSIQNMGMPKRKITAAQAMDENIKIVNLGDGKYSLSFNGRIAKERWNEINDSVKSWGGYYYGKEKSWVMSGDALISFREKYLC